jgi:hypothetical protein
MCLNIIISRIEGAFKVRVHDVYIFVVYFGILHHHHEESKCFVYAAQGAEVVMLVAKDAVGFIVCGSGFVDEDSP